LWPERHPLAYRHFEGILLNGTVLFVGYSLSDPHFDTLLAYVRAITRSREKRLYAWLWRAPASQVKLLELRDKIEAISIGEEEDWKRAFEQVENALLELEAGGGGGLPTAADWLAYERAQYVQTIEARYGSANLQGLYVWGAGYARGDVLLEEIYVEPDLVCGDWRRIPEARSAASLRQARRDEQERQGEIAGREPASRALAREGRLVVVGAPGQGKSTLLRQRLLEAARRWQGRPSEEPFPVYLRLPDWEVAEAGAVPNLLGYSIGALPRLGEISSDAVRTWLEGRVLWLLDGVDEVRDRYTRERMTEEMAAIASVRSEDRWLVATRPAGELQGRLAAGWQRAEMPPLDDRQVGEVLARWARVLERKESLRLDAEEMHGSLVRDRGLARLRGNALLLTLAVLFYKSQRRLPDDRWEFYNVAEQVLRDSWVHHRVHHAAEQLPGSYLPELLEQLALLGMKRGTVTFTRGELESGCRKLLAIREYRGAELDREVALFIRAAEDLIGVLVAQGPGSFGFLHLTFQEFLAARALRNRHVEATALLSRFWDHPDWEELWCLYALAIESDAERYAGLFRELLGNPHLLDKRLQRHRLASFGLVGVGKSRLPREAQRIVRWAVEVLRKGPGVLGDQVLLRLGWWTRSPLPEGVREVLLEQARGERLRWPATRALWIGAREVEAVRHALLARLSDNDPKTRRVATLALSGVVDREEVWRTLLAAINDPDPQVRESTRRVLRWVVREETIWRQLLAWIADDDPLTREGAVRSLEGAVNEKEVRHALLARLGDVHESLWVRVAAAEALSPAVREGEVRTALLARLHEEDEDVDVRAATTRALSAALGNEEVRQVLISRLGDEHEDRSVRMEAAQALAAASEGADERRVLLEHLDDPDNAVWVTVVRAQLGAIGDDKDARRRLLVLVSQEEEDIWPRFQAAAELARAVDDANVRRTLLGLLQKGTRWLPKVTLEALSGVAGEEEVWRPLLASLDDKNSLIRRPAARVLGGAVSEDEVRKALLRCIRDDDLSVRLSVAEALSGAGKSEDARNALIAMLDDSDEDVRHVAFEGLSTTIAVERE
jgi:HEAT repeat protein